jgi:hypothetical protein
MSHKARRGRTRHETVTERAQAATLRIEERLSTAHEKGDLKFFNAQYRARRLAAREGGQGFMPYSAAKARLQRTIADVAAGKATTTLVARVFGDQGGAP